MYIVNAQDVKRIHRELILHDHEAGFVKIGSEDVLALPYHNRKFELPGAEFFGAPEQTAVEWTNAAGESVRLERNDWSVYSLRLSGQVVLNTNDPTSVYELVSFINETYPAIVFGSFKQEAKIDLDRETKMQAAAPLSVRRLHGCKAVFWRMETRDLFAFMWPTRLTFGKKYWSNRMFDSVDLFIGRETVNVKVLSGLKEWPVSIEGKPVSFGSLLEIFRELGVEPIPVFPQ